MKRRSLYLGVGAVVLAGGAWVIVASRRSTPVSSGATPTSAMGAMPGMPGMATSDGSARLTANQIRQFGVTFGTVEMRRLERRREQPASLLSTRRGSCRSRPSSAASSSGCYVNCDRPARSARPAAARDLLARPRGRATGAARRRRAPARHRSQRRTRRAEGIDGPGRGGQTPTPSLGHFRSADRRGARDRAARVARSRCTRRRPAS